MSTVETEVRRATVRSVFLCRGNERRYNGDDRRELGPGWTWGSCILGRLMGTPGRYKGKELGSMIILQ